MRCYYLSMDHYAVFLRGINIGGVRVGMAELQECLTGLGFSEVRTVLQTGNVVFAVAVPEAERVRQILEEALAKQFGREIMVLAYPLAIIRRIIESYPFARTEKRHAYVVMSEGPVDWLDGWSGSAEDEVRLAPVGVYWSVPKGRTLGSPFAVFMAKQKLSPRTTTRNVQTLEKMVK